MTNAVDRLAARIRAVERELLRRKSPQLADSSVEDGSIDVNALDGTQTMAIGKQYDGTAAAAVLTGPPPPTPTAPTSRPSVSGVVAIWDGLFADALVAPMDFARVEVHVGPVSGFYDGSSTYLRGTIESPRGGEVSVPLPDEGAHFIVLVARNLAGGRSPASAEASETPAIITEFVLEDNSVTADKIADFAVPVRKLLSTQHQIY